MRSKSSLVRSKSHSTCSCGMPLPPLARDGVDDRFEKSDHSGELVRSELLYQFMSVMFFVPHCSQHSTSPDAIPSPLSRSDSKTLCRNFPPENPDRRGFSGEVECWSKCPRRRTYRAPVSCGPWLRRGRVHT